MADNVEHGPSDPEEINPKIAGDVHYWAKELGVTGETLHDTIRVHGSKVEKVRAALASHKPSDKGHHDKQGR